MGKRRNKVVSLAVRRARQQQAHDTRVRFVRLYAAAGVGQGSAVAGVVVPMRREESVPSTVHTIGVKPDGAGKFVAVCSCGRYRSNPMGERYAKGAGTRHVKAEAGKVAVAA